MVISNINKVFGKIGRKQVAYRWPVLLAIFLFTVVSCLGLSQLKLSSNEEEWFDDWDSVKLDMDHFKEVFGNDDSFTMMVRADDVFDPEVLQAIDRVGKRLEAEIPYADKVVSLTSRLSIPVANDEGFEIIDPFEKGIPENLDSLKAKVDLIMSRTSLVNNIVSDDRKECWLVLSYLPFDGGIDFAVNNITPKIRDVIFADEFKSDKYKFLPAGMSYTEMEEGEVAGSECAIRVGLGFIISILCLIFFVRSLRGVVVPAISTVFAIASALGINGWIGLVGDQNIIALPVILGMALSVGYSVHYINAFRQKFRVSGNRKESAIQAVEETGWPIFFTVVTTMASLLSFLFAGIKPIRWTGGISAAIVFMVFVYVMVLIPILMSFGKDGKPDPSFALSQGATKMDLNFGKLALKVCTKAVPVAIIVGVVMLLQIPGATKIDVNMDYTKTMGVKIPYVARLLDMLDGKLGSLYSYEVMIEFPEGDALKEPANMKSIEQLEESLGGLSLTKISGEKPRVTSITQMVKEMNRTLNGDSLEYYKIPDEADMLTQLLFLYEISDGEALFDKIDEDYKTAYIHVEMANYDANEIVKNLDSIKVAATKFLPNAKVSVVGEVMNYATMNGRLVKGLLRSFAGSFVMIAILMILAFGSVSAGLIGMLPNIAPVCLIGGIMGYFGMPLDMITMIVMPMILGIAVDDTIHMTNHIKYELERVGNNDRESYKMAIKATFQSIGKTLAMTTIILCVMFFIFVFSPMNALSRIGILSIAGLFAALIADYTLTPALIYIVRPFNKKKK